MIKLPKPEHGSQDWLLNRWRDENGKTTFGASEAASLMSQSPYQTRAALYVAKSHPPKASADNPVFRRGNVLEPALLAEAGYLLGTEIMTPDFQYRRNRFTITMDGVDNADSPKLGVEAKTSTKYSISSSSDLPPEWLWQGWTQQYVLQCPIKFVVLDRNLAITVVDLPDNPKSLQMLEEVSEWFGSLVDQQELPDWDFDELNAEEVSQLYKYSPSEVELPPMALDLVYLLDTARANKKTAEIAEQEAKDALARMLQGAEIGTVDGVPVISWKEYQGRLSLDTKALQGDHPDLCAEYQKQGSSFRTMKSITKRKGG